LVDICKSHDLDTLEKLEAWLKNQFQITIREQEKFVQKKLI